MKKIVIENLLPSIVTLVIGTLLGVYVTSRQGEQENKKRFLDYRYSVNSGIINVSEANVGNDIKVFYKDRLIDNLTTVNISIANFSDRDYENVPIYIDLSTETGDSLEIIRVNYAGQNGLQDEIEYKGETKLTSISKRFEFNTKIANRSESDKNYSQVYNNPFLSISFLIIGNHEPKLSVKIKKVGLGIREYDYDNYKPWGFLDSPIAILGMILLGVVGYFLMIIFISKVFLKKSFEKREQKRKAYLVDKLSIELSNISNSKGLVDRITEIEKQFFQENASAFTKWLVSMTEKSSNDSSKEQ
ncbi:MAG TPA: hypothetical protein VL443_12330 [Cyclobacteriaceae bacterium]|jgi:hypothetical protein|nr:hypothetical protein [Cyclobacteriaceae bacterium]